LAFLRIPAVLSLVKEFLNELASQLGLPEEQVAKASGTVFAFLEKQLSPEQFREVVSAIPGAAAFLANQPPMGASGNGVLGGLGSLFGGSNAALFKLAEELQAAGIDPAKLPFFAKTFLTELRRFAGDESVDKLLAKLPDSVRSLFQ
jgi:uncharacterized protein (DUF2267 family)